MLGALRRCHEWHNKAGALRVGPAEIAFEAKNKLVVLPIVASKRAADHTIGRGAVLDDSAFFFDMGAAPQITDMSADVEAGPVVNGRRSGARRGGALTGMSAADATCAHAANAAAITAIDTCRMTAPNLRPLQATLKDLSAQVGACADTRSHAGVAKMRERAQ